MYDEFIMLSTDRIISTWDFRVGTWKEIYDWNNFELLWGFSIRKVAPKKVYAILYENGKSEWLTEDEGKEFISIFKGRYGINATLQTEKESK